MNNPTPFSSAWWSIELPRHRPCDSTYCFFEYESLPPLPIEQLRGDFNWLRPLDSELSERLEIYRPSEEKRERLSKKLKIINASALELGLTLPPPFLRFMGDLDLQDRIPSCTACYFDLDEAFIPSPAGEGGYLLRFLNDQQDVLLWYLYLHPSGAQAVVVSPYYYTAEPPDAELRPAVIQHTRFCAPSFEEFMYRFWIENKIWFALADSQGELTEAMRAYLKHYRLTPDTQ